MDLAKGKVLRDRREAPTAGIAKISTSVESICRTEMASPARNGRMELPGKVKLFSEIT
jgi:hypothetical protein